MTRVKAVIKTQNHHPDQLMKSHGGNLKAARMFLSVAVGQQGGNNERWDQTLQSLSDYLIRFKLKNVNKRLL